MIKNIVSQFIEAVNTAPHLLPLYAKKELNILLQWEEGQLGIVIHNKKINIQSFQIDEANITITGSKEELKQLLYGEEKLFLMTKRNDLTVEGRYRDSLQIEALFLLAKFRMQQVNTLHQLA
jgi:hypothetical protein